MEGMCLFLSCDSQLAEQFHTQVYMIFGTILMGSLIHVFLFFQETRGRTLEEMDEVFDQSVWAFKVHYTSRLAGDVDRAREMIDSGKATTVEEEVVDDVRKDKL